MKSNQTLEERTNLPLDDFGAALRKHDVQGLSYPAFYSDGYSAGVIDVKSEYSRNPGWVRVGVFKTREDGERRVFDVTIHRGPAMDIVYLEASSKLRKALETEGIPFTDKRDIGKLREEAGKYARKLLEISEDL